MFFGRVLFKHRAAWKFHERIKHCARQCAWSSEKCLQQQYVIIWIRLPIWCGLWSGIEVHSILRESVYILIKDFCGILWCGFSSIWIVCCTIYENQIGFSQSVDARMDFRIFFELLFLFNVIFLLWDPWMWWSYSHKVVKVYDPITFGFIHRNGVLGIRWKLLFFYYLSKIRHATDVDFKSYRRKYSESSEIVVTTIITIYELSLRFHL